MCIQIPKQETLKSADNKITYVIYLKHTLELVEPLRASLENCECEFLQACQKVTYIISEMHLDSLYAFQHYNV